MRNRIHHRFHPTATHHVDAVSWNRLWNTSR
ncbi:Uncharacterised protein [Vibrio cholerae]|nr:Uncharacterised protein [Vibrio cholerae]